MRRSEMLRVIQDAVFLASAADLVLDSFEADEVLRRIESAGMLPPPYYRGESGDIFIDGEFRAEWEPENE